MFGLEPQFAFPGAVLQVWVVAMLAASVRQGWMAARIDCSQPVAMIQKHIEGLRMFRIRVTQWGLLTGQLVWWMPFPIIAFKGFWGVELYRYVSTSGYNLNQTAAFVASISEFDAK